MCVVVVYDCWCVCVWGGRDCSVGGKDVMGVILGVNNEMGLDFRLMLVFFSLSLSFYYYSFYSSFLLCVWVSKTLFS